ncbi:unnamed protein product [Aureobasidium pullulans]|nr:unnamed protein product [Aureobasidium pullulans]
MSNLMQLTGEMANTIDDGQDASQLVFLASLSGANNIKHDAFVRQALEDGRYYVRDWTRLHTGWTSQDSNLEATTIAAYEHMFGEPGVLCCEDGRSALCRIWHHNLKICRKCDTLYCGPCGKMHEDPAKENTKHRARPAALKRKAKRAIERGL